MKKKLKTDNDIAAMMNKIQGQLAVLDSKLDSFMTKSLTELAQALANSKPAPRPVIQAAPRVPQNNYPASRPMYAVVCFECGIDTELPFKPSGNRPVYCKECFAKRKGRPAPVSTGGASVVSVSPPAVSAPAKAKAKAKKAATKPAKATKKSTRKPVGKKK